MYWHQLRSLGAAIWARAAGYAIVGGLLVAIPTRLVPNGLFSRMTPTRPQDYLFWTMASLLLGLALALRTVGSGRQDAKTLGGGVGTFLAVGCPVCNKLVVAILGVGGALSIFAPLQPVIALASLALLLSAVRVGLRALASTCTASATSRPEMRN